jgi:transcriptional regulator with XRE-family HTH domain
MLLRRGSGDLFYWAREGKVDDITTRVGFNIRRVREERGLTQERLGELSGLHRAYVGQIERGEKNIGVRNLERLSAALGVKVVDLFDDSLVAGRRGAG